jgi:pyridoxine 5-phosphate synthase
MEKVIPRLSVNINKIALIRNSRGGNLPDLVQMALDIESYGAAGITVHPRPDQRHIRYSDIPALKSNIRTELNIEGYPSADFIALVLRNVPAQVTLVPDPPDTLTSDQGWDIVKHKDFLKDIVSQFHTAGIRVSIFINAEPAMVDAAAAIGADRIELYTGPYAHDYDSDRLVAVSPHVACAARAIEKNIEVNAGHDLNLKNLAWYSQSLPVLHEVSIGHALISDALYYGYSNAIHMYKDRLIYPELY